MRGGKAVWIGWSMGDDSTDEILRWAEGRAGGPGVAPPPPTLKLQFIQSAGERTRDRTRRR